MLRFQWRPASTQILVLFLAIVLPSIVSAGEPAFDFAMREMTAEYTGNLAHLLEAQAVQPLSLATADFDEDGVPDLVVGYGDGADGFFVVHRGNLEAIYPRPGEEAGSAFLPHAQVFASLARADHIATGDFDADGHFDIAAATTWGTALELHRGDGTGRFAGPESIELGGRLTAMTAGEVNRRDGLVDVVVGVDRTDGPKILVFESPLGALRGAPESIDAFDTVESIELGNHDDDFMRDIAAVTESYRIDVKGRDRRLSLGRLQRSEVPDAVVSTEPVSVYEKKTDPPAFAELLDGEIVAHLTMRLNRDAFPDSIVIVEGQPNPVVVKTLTRAIFTVDSTADDPDFSTGDGVCDTDDSVGDGPCTLRAAIEQANASAGADAIEFDIAGTGPHSIQPTSALPAITDAVTIDGTTEPDFAGSPVVELDGTNAGTSITGIYVSAANTTVRGLVINNIDRDAIVIAASAETAVIEGNFIGIDTAGSSAAPITRYGIANWGAADMTFGGTTPEARNVVSGIGNAPIALVVASSTGSKIQGNYFGTDVSGSTAIPNGNSIGATAPGVTVGGAVPGAGNVITSASIGLGVGGTDAVVFGNFIGTDATGMLPLGNNNWGIGLGATNAQIGGTTPLHRNVISGNGADGISISGPTSTGVLIQGNYIGVGSDGVTPLGNGRHGLVFGNSGGLNTVGGTAPGTANIIANNGRDGVLVHTHDVSIPILGNSIHSNLEEGIDLDWQMYTYGDGVTPNDPGDLDTGGNNLQNFPIITLISSDGSTVDGTLNSLASTQFDLEFFGNTTCDPSGHGEGETLLGTGTVTTDGAGDGAFSIVLPSPVPAGSYVTSTATDPLGNTSEFSACVHYTVEADLAITKDDGVTTVIAGTQTTYTIVASNPSGPGPAVGATVTDLFPPELSCSWTCVGAGSGTCTAGPVAGDINDTVNLPVGGTATYTAVCDIDPGASGSLSNTATVTAPAGVTDPTPGNNSATDVDTVLVLDFGDAPDPTYPTLFANDGARHVLGGGLFLGVTVDADADGQPTANADGDDTDGNDDEDGVVFTSVAVTGYTANVDVNASAAGLLNAWVDFNADGDWLDPGEQVFTDQALAAGANALGFTVPASATLGQTATRFRVDTAGGLAPDGLALDGEVEDHAIEIRSSTLDIRRTGQTTSYAAGDDGGFQMGTPWPVPRFVDNADGTVSDQLTGLMWTQDNVNPGPAPCNPGVTRDWFLSLSYVDCLNTNSYLGHNDWRMPNIVELVSLIHFQETDLRPWWSSQGFTSTTILRWWSSTTTPSGLSQSSTMTGFGTLSGFNKAGVSGTAVWPVRGGPDGGATRLPATGQARCWDASYAEVPCAGTGQDGDHRAGAAWPSPRFEVAGDCVTDRLTGLTWTKDGNPIGFRSWRDAIEDTLALSLCGFDDWRLPTVLELRSLMHHDKRTDPVPGSLFEWWESQGFVNVTTEPAWSGTTYSNFIDSAWTMQSNYTKDIDDSVVVWPVRGNVQTDTADLAVVVMDSSDPVNQGGNVIYTIDVSNLGPNTANEVTITNTIPAGSTYVSATGTGWTCGEDSGVVTCTDTSVAPGPAALVDIEITAPMVAGPITNAALVDSLQSDPVAENNFATESTNVSDIDYGDAPDPTYPTLAVSDGARHTLGSGLFLGEAVDSEADGQPTATADGDDIAGIDDEDGVVFTSGLGAGLDAGLDVTASGAGLLNAWIDFNADGDWADAGEQILVDQALAAGANPLTFPVPVAATLGTTFARFRFDSTGSLSFDGLALDGEVEDYMVEIVEGPDLEIDMVASSNPTASGHPLTYTVTVTNNGPLPATSVTVTDTLPGELIFVSSIPGAPGCTYAADTLTCDLGTMAPTDTAQITIETTLDHPVWGTVNNTSSVAATELDPISANNTATVDTKIALFVDGFESGDLTAWD